MKGKKGKLIIKFVCIVGIIYLVTLVFSRNNIVEGLTTKFGGVDVIWDGGWGTDIKGDSGLPTYHSTLPSLHVANGPHHKIVSDVECAKICIDDPTCKGISRSTGGDYWCKPVWGNITKLQNKQSWLRGIQLRESDDAIKPESSQTMCSDVQTAWINDKMKNEKWTQEKGEGQQNCIVPENLQSRIKEPQQETQQETQQEPETLPPVEDIDEPIETSLLFHLYDNLTESKPITTTKTTQKANSKLYYSNVPSYFRSSNPNLSGSVIYN